VPNPDEPIADRNIARALEVIEQVAVQTSDADEKRMLSAAGSLVRAIATDVAPDAVAMEEVRRALSN
jgi:hypothetical protein